MLKSPRLPSTRRGILAGIFALPLLTAATDIAGRTQFSEAYPLAEMFTGAVVVRDLLDGGSIDNWVLPEANYLVPDWILWFLLEGAGIGPMTSVWLFGVLQLAVLLLLWVGIARHLPRGLHNPGVFVAPFLLWLVIMGGGRPAAYVLVSYWRFGTVLLTFAALLLTLEIFATGALRRQLPLALLLGATIAAAHTSDEAIAAWFTLPAAIALAILTRSNVFSRRGAAVWAGAVAIGHAIGLLIEPSIGIRLDSYQAWISVTAIPDRIIEFVRVYNIEFGNQPATAAMVVVGIALTTSRRRAGVFGPVRQFLAWYLLAASIVIIFAQLMLAGPSPLGARMVTHVVVLSILLLGFEAAETLRTIEVPRSLAWIVLLTISFLVLGRITPESRRDIGLAVEFQDVSCVREALEPYAGTAGLASFASQNAILFYTDLDLKITNAWDLDPFTIEPAEWPYNVTWRTDDPAFVIADDWSYEEDPWPILTRQPVVLHYGEPAAEVDCTRWQVLLYD